MDRHLLEGNVDGLSEPVLDEIVNVPHFGARRLGVVLILGAKMTADGSEIVGDVDLDETLLALFDGSVHVVVADRLLQYQGLVDRHDVRVTVREAQYLAVIH